MADKEAIVYIIDVGRPMGKKHGGRGETDLEWAMTYIWDKITTIVSGGRKTQLQGVIGLRTDETDNEQQEEEGYENISVWQELGQIQMPDIHRLKNMVKSSGTRDGDAISAIVVAIQMISKTCKKLKYKRQIMLISSGRGEMDTHMVPEIVDKLKEDDIQLTILGVDFDDPDSGYKEEDKDPDKAETEKVLNSLTEECNGSFGTLREAIEELDEPRKKKTRPTPTFKGQLMLGDPDNKYGNTMFIDIERYPKTMVQKSPSATTYFVRNPESNQSSTTLMQDASGVDQLVNPGREMIYEVEDPKAPNGKCRVPFEELAKGYDYGRSAVPISDSDWSVTKLETKTGLQILGFVPMEKFSRSLPMSQSSIIVAQKQNMKAIMAFSSFTRALHEVGSHAIGRLVTKDDKAPLLVVLAPLIEPDFECLVQLELPFAEDVRRYEFPPLDRIITVSGKEIKEHRNLPNKDLQQAMSDYVDAMDVSTYHHDDEEGDSAWAEPEDVWSPMLHRLERTIRVRAVDPKKPLPETPNLLKYSTAPKDIVETSRKQREHLIKVADVKKVPEKTKSRKRKAEQPTPISGLDIDAMLKSALKDKKVRIDPENAIPDFKKYLLYSDDPNRLKDGAAQLSNIIENRVRESFGDMNYMRCVEEMTVFRDEMEEYEEVGVWNDWAKRFKKKLFDEELGGPRLEMWVAMRKAHLGLWDKSHGKGGVAKEEAAAFLTWGGKDTEQGLGD